VKTGRSSAKRSTAATSSRKAATGKSTGSRQGSTKIPAPIARVTRVAQEVAKEAGSAVVAGMEAIKDLGSSVVERVTG
jgi:hypothetical protein